MTSKKSANKKKGNNTQTKNKKTKQTATTKKRTKLQERYRKIADQHAVMNAPPITKPNTPVKSTPKDIKPVITDHYPEIAKRKTNIKKVILKPKYNLKRLTEHKRKNDHPQRDSNYPAKSNKLDSVLNKDLYRGLTVTEVIILKEQTEELTDEDFMEILTCPSPVWWEESLTDNSCDENDSINCAAIEDPIIHNKDEEKIDKITKNKEHEKEKHSEHDLKVPEITENKFEKNFLEKRSSLENVLFSIKNKSTCKPQNEFSSKTDLKKHEVLTSNEITDNDDEDDKCIFEDISKTEAILKDLESINLPIAGMQNSNGDSLIECIVIDEDEDEDVSTDSLTDKMASNDLSLANTNSESIIKSTNPNENTTDQFFLVNQNRNDLDPPLQKVDSNKEITKTKSNFSESFIENHISAVEHDETKILKENNSNNRADEVNNKDIIDLYVNILKRRIFQKRNNNKFKNTNENVETEEIKNNEVYNKNEGNVNNNYVIKFKGVEQNFDYNEPSVYINEDVNSLITTTQNFKETYTLNDHCQKYKT